MKILSIDGGGIRGLYAARILENIKESIGVEYEKKFDLLAGTSTGSIIAAALAIKYPISEVVKLYLDKGSEIFSKNKRSFSGFYKEKYLNGNLKKYLSCVFKDKRLKDVDVHLLIPSTDIGNATVHVFKSNYDTDFVRDPDRFISDAVLASCSAPAFFKPVYVNGYLLADGGMWANNPSLVCITEAIRRFDCDIKDIRILSLGTGIGHNYYDINNYLSKKWGLLTGWGGRKLVNTIFNLQSASVDNSVNLILPKGNYLRVNFEANKKLDLDDISMTNELVTRADADFAKYFVEIRDFLGE